MTAAADQSQGDRPGTGTTLVHDSGTIMYMQRRPRIDQETAAAIDALRDTIPFERYVNDVLQRHAAHSADRGADLGPGRRRLLAMDDVTGRTDLFVDQLDGGWADDDYDGVIAGIAISDEELETVGFYLRTTELRALRDACTELLEDQER